MESGTYTFFSKAAGRYLSHSDRTLILHSNPLRWTLKSSGKKINLSKIAVMGCAVNGPGEARDADLGIAGSKSGQILVFAKGKVLGAFEEEAGFAFFKDELLKHCGE